MAISRELDDEEAEEDELDTLDDNAEGGTIEGTKHKV